MLHCPVISYSHHLDSSWLLIKISGDLDRDYKRTFCQSVRPAKCFHSGKIQGNTQLDIPELWFQSNNIWFIQSQHIICNLCNLHVLISKEAKKHSYFNLIYLHNFPGWRRDRTDWQTLSKSTCFANEDLTAQKDEIVPPPHPHPRQALTHKIELIKT